MTASMTEVGVRLVRLEPMKVAAVRVVSETPEIDAWRKLRAWAEPRGLLDNEEKHPVFGFANPGPAPDRNLHGYEYWIRVDSAAQPTEDVEIKHFDGGLFAVATTALTALSNTWNDLWDWARSHGYQWRRTHELEKISNPISMDEELLFELYLPVQQP